MIGAIIGDIVGSKLDLKNIDDKNSDLFAGECHITGNTVMMLAVAKAIMETDKKVSPSSDRCEHNWKYYSLLHRNATRYIREFGSKYSKYYYGEELKKWISGDSSDCLDDGVILRIIPVGFCAWSKSQAEKMSDAIASGTLNELIEDHNESKFNVDYDFSEYIFAVNRSTIKTKLDGFSVYGKFRESGKKYIVNPLETSDITFNAKKAFKDSKSFDEAVRMAVKHGGSFAGAIAGALSEAYFGVPKKYKEKLHSFLDEELNLVLDEWISFSRNIVSQGRFKILTKHISTISLLKSFDIIHDGKAYDYKEHPFHLPIPIDSRHSDEINYDLISLIDTYPEYGLNEYRYILKENGLECSWNGMVNVDYDLLDAQCILAILAGIVSSDKSTNEKVLDFFNEGHLLRALKRLSNIDYVEAPPVEEIRLNYGGFCGGYKDYCMVFDDTAKLTVKDRWFDDFMPLDGTEYSIEETKTFIETFNDIHVEHWDHNYQCKYDICDGTQWTLNVKYKGQRGIEISGNNDFPKNFGRLNKIFDIRYRSDDDFVVDRLVFGLERSIVMNEEGELERSPGRVIETLIIDRNKNQITHERTVNSKKGSRSYNASIDIIDILAFAKDCINAEEWTDTLKRNVIEGSSYFTFEAELDTGDVVLHHGVYDANSIPEKPWTLFMKSVRDYLERFVIQDIMDDQTFDRTPRNGKVRYCNVMFDDVARPYYYRTEDGKIKKGDRVRVPFGREERVGVVIEAANYDLDKVPFSMEKTRGIIHKVKE